VLGAMADGVGRGAVVAARRRLLMAARRGSLRRLTRSVRALFARTDAAAESAQPKLLRPRARQSTEAAWSVTRVANSFVAFVAPLSSAMRAHASLEEGTSFMRCTSVPCTTSTPASTPA